MSAVDSIAALEARDATGRGLRIEFFRSQDRYAHRILAVGCEELPVILLESVEGTVDDHWPTSPALQALNLDDLQDCEQSTESPPAAMLVGMAGSTHWSMSVKPLLNSDVLQHFGRQPGFHFDTAARLKSVPKVLSTRYLVGKRVRVQRSGDGILLHFGSGQCHLDSRASDGTIAQSGWQLDKRGNELQHERAPNASQLQLPTTIRWGYSLSLLGD